MDVEGEARKLKTMADVEMAYTLVMIVGILVCAVFASEGYWQSIPAMFVLFVPKFWMHARWSRQLEVVKELSPAARALAERRGY